MQVTVYAYDCKITVYSLLVTHATQLRLQYNEKYARCSIKYKCGHPSIEQNRNNNNIHIHTGSDGAEPVAETVA